MGLVRDRLIGDLLDTTRIDANQLELSVEPTDLPALGTTFRFTLPQAAAREDAALLVGTAAS